MLQDVDAAYVLFLFHVVGGLKRGQQFRSELPQIATNCLLLEQLVARKIFFALRLNSQRLSD